MRSNAEIREAVLKTADFLERNPKMWSYFNSWVPDCNTPGCALGLIGVNLGARPGLSIESVAVNIGVKNAHEFYARMNPLSLWWMGGGEHAVGALRLYADTYHPAGPAYVPEVANFKRPMVVGGRELVEA